MISCIGIYDANLLVLYLSDTLSLFHHRESLSMCSSSGQGVFGFR